MLGINYSAEMGTEPLEGHSVFKNADNVPPLIQGHLECTGVTCWFSGWGTGWVSTPTLPLLCSQQAFRPESFLQ